MNLKNCTLYELKRKKDLKYLLNYNDNPLNYDDFNSYITPYIEYDQYKQPRRLIEKLKKEAKQCNKLVYKKLSTIDTPEWHFSKKGSGLSSPVRASKRMSFNFVIAIEICSESLHSICSSSWVKIVDEELAFVFLLYTSSTPMASFSCIRGMHKILSS